MVIPISELVSPLGPSAATVLGDDDDADANADAENVKTYIAGCIELARHEPATSSGYLESTS